MPIRDRGVPENEPMGAGDFMAFDADGKNGHIENINELPPELLNKLDTIRNAVSMLVVAFKQLQENPTDVKKSEEFLGMIQDVLSSPEMGVAILSMGISAIAEFYEEGDK